MAISVLNTFIDANTLLTLSKSKEGATTTGHLMQMVCLAMNDPEGCVRPFPTTTMTAEMFAETFSCTSEEIIRSVETLQQYRLVTMENGKLYVDAVRKDKAAKAARKVKRQHRQDHNINGNDYEKNSHDYVDNNSHDYSDAHNYETEHGSDHNDVHNYNYNYINNNKELINNYNYNYDDSPLPESDPPTPPPQNSLDPNKETGRDGLPFLRDTGALPDRLISLENLPAPCRNMLAAWNRLGLKSFSGLYPALIKNANALLETYGEETVLRTINSIAQSPFLLGKNNTPNRWHATFSWLLKPENFEKLRSGQYHVWGQGDACHGDGSPSPDGRTSFLLPGEGCEPLTDAQQAQAKEAFYHPRNALLDEMSQDLCVAEEA